MKYLKLFGFILAFPFLVIAVNLRGIYDQYKERKNKL